VGFGSSNAPAEFATRTVLRTKSAFFNMGQIPVSGCVAALIPALEIKKNRG
jgi:hypothetical protein